MNQLKALAAEIFARRGVDMAGARQGPGWTNATWIAGGMALRIAKEPGTDRIRREAALSAHFPAAVGYPAVIETGVEAGHAWSLAREVPGENLGEVWEDLDEADRMRAMQGAWTAARMIHTINPDAVRALASDAPWYMMGADEADAAVAGFVRDARLTAAQGRALRARLGRFFAALPTAQPVLNHGDLTMHNMLWNPDGRLSLMDFEHAVIGPVQIDLYALLRFALGPSEAGGTPDSKPDGALGREALFLAAPLLTGRRDCDVLLGYAVLISLRRMAIWLEHIEDKRGWKSWEPHRSLVSLSDGRGGYLAPAVAQFLG